MKKFFYLILAGAFTFAFSNAATAQQNRKQERDRLPQSELSIKSAQKAKEKPVPETRKIVVPKRENKDHELHRREAPEKEKQIIKPRIIIDTPQLKKTGTDTPAEK